MPIANTRKEMKDMESGQVLEILATDKDAKADLTAWAKLGGHELLETEEAGDVFKSWIKKAFKEVTKDEFYFIIVIFLIGFIGSFISGMVGIGEAIIKYPMLLCIPPMLGVAEFTSHEVAGITAVEIFFATIAGVWAYRNSGLLNKTIIVYMGGAVLIGSFLGGFGSTFLSEQAVNIVYALLATLAVILMFIPNKGLDDVPLYQVQFNRWLAAGLALIAGLAAGVVGARRSVYSRADHAGCFENSYPHDDCVLIGYYLHFLYRFGRRENMAYQVLYGPAL